MYVAAMIPAAIICTVMGLVSAYTFSLIGSACEQHQADSFQVLLFVKFS